jgi:hypothetical protein
MWLGTTTRPTVKRPDQTQPRQVNPRPATERERIQRGEPSTFLRQSVDGTGFVVYHRRESLGLNMRNELLHGFLTCSRLKWSCVHIGFMISIKCKITCITDCYTQCTVYAVHRAYIFHSFIVLVLIFVIFHLTLHVQRRNIRIALICRLAHAKAHWVLDPWLCFFRSHWHRDHLVLHGRRG